MSAHVLILMAKGQAKGVYRDPAARAEGVSSQPLSGLAHGHPLPLGLTLPHLLAPPDHTIVLPAAVTRAIANTWDLAVAKSDKCSVVSLAGDEAWTRHGPPQSALDSHVARFTPK